MKKATARKVAIKQSVSMRKAVIRQSDGYVANIIVIENGANWQLPEGYYLIDAGDGSPGDTWNGTNFIKPELPIIESPHSSHIAILVAVDPTKARLAKVKRTWNGNEYFYDCFVAQCIKDEYQAEKIRIGDYVLVHFDDDMGEILVTAKVFKSW